MKHHVVAGSLALAVVVAAHGAVQTFPREGWSNAVFSRTDNGWRVQAGPQVMNVSVQSKDKSLGDRLKLSIVDGALSIDAAELTAAGAGLRTSSGAMPRLRGFHLPYSKAKDKSSCLARRRRSEVRHPLRSLLVPQMPLAKSA
jgi:hypothetical protein